MAGCTIKMSVECRELMAVIRSLPADRAALAKFPEEIAHEVVSLAEAPEQLFSLKVDAAVAARTGEVIVRLDPSDRLLRLTAALGAQDAE